jgi:DNA-binding CsgD family transcriptional regulator
MAEPLSHQALSELIGAIYDCAIDPDRWDPALAKITDAFGSAAAVLALADLRDNRILINRSVGVTPDGIATMARYTPEINAVLEDFLSEHPSLDDPWVMRRDMKALEASPYYNEALKPQGFVDGMIVFPMRTPTHYSAFWVGNDARAGLVTSRQVELGRLLLPHVRRAVTISNVLDVRTIERARIAEALDALNCGVVLTNALGAILHANRPAGAMLRNAGPLRDARGMLTVASPAAARELSAAIRLAAEDESRIGRHGLAVRLNGPDAPPVLAHVLPLTGSDFRTDLQPDACAAVFVRAAPDERACADGVAAAFGLTPAETRVLARLLAGRTLADTAADLRVAASTVRTHLDSIFLKTGVARQAELMRLAMQVEPPAP